MTRSLLHTVLQGATVSASAIGSLPPSAMLQRGKARRREALRQKDCAKLVHIDFTKAQAEFIDLPHDVMLCSGWEKAADRIIEWVTELRKT